MTHRVGRRTTLIGITVLAVSVAGCGSKDGTGGGDGDDSIRVSGQVTNRGHTPFSTPFFESKDGQVYAILVSDVADELRELQGMDLSISGRLASARDGELPTIEVYSYEILRLPTGEKPIVGVIAGSPPDIWLVDEGGRRWIIAGDLHAVLLDFVGAKVWIVGDVDETRSDKRASVLNVVGYGMIRPTTSGVTIE